MLKTAALTSVLALGLVNTANAAGKAYSWDLSPALINRIDINPRGVWAFMQNTSGVDNPANYTLLPNYSSTCFGIGPLRCWTNTIGLPIVGVATKTFSWRDNLLVKGFPYLHPGLNVPVIIRWQSPINGSVNVMGRISAIDPNCCGDGVNWSLKNNNAAVIRSGHLDQGQGAAFSAQNIAISKGEKLYFMVDMKGTTFNDSTRLDLLITSQQ